MLSNHDVVRHATRLAPAQGPYRVFTLPRPGELDDAAQRAGAARAAAATLMVLALPGSTYLYQGEELGLPEVLGIPQDQARDPSARYDAGGVAVAGRDGCRVPLPWAEAGPSYGFGAGGSWLPQPAWFGTRSVQAQERDPASVLALHRAALRLRRRLQGPERLAWLELGEGVLAFERPGGWASVTNVAAAPLVLPPGRVLLRSDAFPDAAAGPLPAGATAWLLTGSTGSTDPTEEP